MGQVPEPLARQLADAFGLRRAVETGTYLGQSRRVLAQIFDRVETIELSPRLARRARLRLLLKPGVRVRCGDSGELLSPAAEPTFYWLDAHWSGGITAGEDNECPVVDEIRATSPGTASDCYLIDDAHMFTKPVPPPHRQEDWPTLEALEELLASVRPDHELHVVDDLDVLAAVPRGYAIS